MRKDDDIVIGCSNGSLWPCDGSSPRRMRCPDFDNCLSGERNPPRKLAGCAQLSTPAAVDSSLIVQELEAMCDWLAEMLVGGFGWDYGLPDGAPRGDNTVDAWLAAAREAVKHAD